MHLKLKLVLAIAAFIAALTVVTYYPTSASGPKTSVYGMSRKVKLGTIA